MAKLTLTDVFMKAAFVPMPGGQPMPPQGAPAPQGAPMDPAMMAAAQGQDPAALAAAQGAPMDPGMAAAAGVPGAAPAPTPAPAPAAPAGLPPELQGLIAQEVQKAMGGQGGAGAGAGAGKGKGGKQEERLSNIEAGMHKILGILAGKGQIPASEIMPKPEESEVPAMGAPAPDNNADAAGPMPKAASASGAGDDSIGSDERAARVLARSLISAFKQASAG